MASSLHLNSVVKGVGADAPVSGLHRVLWKSAERDEVYLIEIPTWPAGAPAPRYHRSPKKLALSKLVAWEAAGEITVTQVVLNPVMLLSDQEIRELYPSKNRRGRSNDGRRKGSRPIGDEADGESEAILFRDERWSWVAPIEEFIRDHRADAFELGLIGEKVRQRAKETGREPTEIYDAINRVLAYAAGKSSLLPFLFRCGGAGKRRSLRKASRLGRPGVGIHLSEEDKRRICIGYSKFLREGKSVRDAWILTLGTWWSSGSKIVDGQEVPVLLDANRCPTLAQFRYWGPGDATGKTAFELLLRRDVWDKKFRAMLGSSKDGIRSVGQVGVMDATGTHVTFVSPVSMIDAVGPGHRIVVHDALCETITGFYCGFEAPSEATADLAVLNSAEEKVEYFARFGLEITPDQVPACFYARLRMDNGEGRTRGFITKTLGSGGALELVERFRAERKQQCETGHRSLHRLLDDHLDGATHGKPAARGDDAAAVPACWPWFEYMRQFLKAVIYFNCEADATSVMDRHPFRTEMLRAGVPPRRAAMFKWCVENDRNSMPAYDVEFIRARCLPVFKASVKRSGVYLIRPDKGDKVELIKGPRFVGTRGVELGWHAGRREDFHIELKLDAYHPNRAYYFDRQGVHIFENASNDELSNQEATIHDLMAMQDAERRSASGRQDASNQALSDYVSGRENKNLELRERKKVTIERAGGKVPKARLKANQTANRATEMARVERLLDPLTRAPHAPKDAGGSVDEARPPLSSEGESVVEVAMSLDRAAACSEEGAPSSVLSALERFRKQRRRA